MIAQTKADVLAVLFIFISVFCFAKVALSQTLNSQQMLIIRETAASICNTVEAKGRKTETQLQGDVKAQLNGLIGKLVDVGASSRGSLSREEFEGLSREATAEALTGDRNCRERVFGKMLDKLTLESSSSVQADKTLADLAIPPINLGASEIKAKFPSGNWKADPQGAFFEYRTAFDGFDLIAKYYKKNVIDQSQFSEIIVEYSYQYAIAYSEKYGDKKSGSSDLQDKACSTSFDKFFSVVVESLGPPIDKPRVVKEAVGDVRSLCSGLPSWVKCRVSGNVSNETRYFRSNKTIAELVKLSSSEMEERNVTDTYTKTCRVTLKLSRG